MFNNNLLRVGGIAGIVSAILMLALTAVMGSDTSSPFLTVYFLVGGVLGLALTGGLFVYFREEGTVAVVAAAASAIGYLFFIIAGLLSLSFENPIIALGDALVYIVGVPLFSWLAYRTGKMSRILAIIGFVAGAAGLTNYTVTIITGADWTNPNDPMAGVLSAIYMVYLIAVLIWLLWTGYSLVSAKTEPALA
jgi:hypothetical protein